MVVPLLVLLTVVVVLVVTVVEFDPTLGDLAGVRSGDDLVGLGESRDEEREFWRGGSGGGGDADAGADPTAFVVKDEKERAWRGRTLAY